MVTTLGDERLQVTFVSLLNYSQLVHLFKKYSLMGLCLNIAPNHKGLFNKNALERSKKVTRNDQRDRTTIDGIPLYIIKTC